MWWWWRWWSYSGFVHYVSWLLHHQIQDVCTANPEWSCTLLRWNKCHYIVTVSISKVSIYSQHVIHSLSSSSLIVSIIWSSTLFQGTSTRWAPIPLEGDLNSHHKSSSILHLLRIVHRIGEDPLEEPNNLMPYVAQVESHDDDYYEIWLWC